MNSIRVGYDPLILFWLAVIAMSVFGLAYWAVILA